MVLALQDTVNPAGYKAKLKIGAAKIWIIIDDNKKIRKLYFGAAIL